MKNIYIFSTILLLSAILLVRNSFAVTAYPFPVQITQRDGTVITVILQGDEKLKFAKSTDGYTVLYNKHGVYEYGIQDASGDLVPSGVKAYNVSERTQTETTFLVTVPKDLKFSHSQLSIMRQVTNMSKSSNPQREFPSTGNRKLICILIGFTDLSFSKTNTDFQNLFNQVGYNVDGATGSVKDFFVESSYNQLNLTVDVSGPYTADYNQAYYGGNDVSGYDQRPRELVTEAVLKADPYVNYTNYDNDNDGAVDGVYVIFAGYGEEAGGGTDCIWSHAWDIDPVVCDGESISRYSCSPALRNNSGAGLTRIGVICHEFGHVLGAPDFYDTDYATGGQFDGTGYWDLQAGGSWNNNGATPAQPNPYTKVYVYNWATATTLSTQTTVTLQNAAKYSNSFYRFNTNTSGEFYLMENRQNVGFDSYLPGHGLMIYHVNKDIAFNDINITHPQMMYPVCANANSEPNFDPASYGNISSSDCPFPGTSFITSFTDYTLPSQKSWAGYATAKPITNITENSSTKTITLCFISCAAPGADFSADVTNTCTGNTVSFSDLSTNSPISWTWSFNPSTVNYTGGTNSTSQNPKVIFNAVGTYSVTLYAYDGSVVDTKAKTNYITVSALPSAAATITGDAKVYKGQTGTTYTVPVIANATKYVWSLPAGATITAGSNTNTIIVSYSAAAVSGIAKVYGSNTCGNGTVSADFSITVGEAISAACSNANNIAVNTVTSTVTVNGTPGQPLLTDCSTKAIVNEGWFKFTATTAYTAVTFSSFSYITAYLYVYSGSCGALTKVSCMSITAGNINLLNFATLIGQQYYIRILNVDAGVVTGRIGVYSNSGTNAMLCIPAKSSMNTGNANQAGVKNDNILNVGDQKGSMYSDNYSVGFIKFPTSDIPQSYITINGISFALTYSDDNLTAGGRQAITKLKNDAIDPVTAKATEIYQKSTEATAIKFYDDIGPAYTSNTTYIYTLNSSAVSNFSANYTKNWWGLCIPVEWNDGYWSGDYVNYYGWNSQYSPYLVVTYSASDCNSPKIITHPLSQTKCTGSDVSLTVEASGSATLVYQWKKNNIAIDGATNSTLNIQNSKLTDAATYICLVSNNCGTATSNSASLNMQSSPSVSLSPTSPSICAGAAVTFTATTSGTIPFTYIWQKNNSTLTDATASTLKIQNSTISDAGVYAVYVTNSCGTNSSSSELTVISLPAAAATITGPAVVNRGQSGINYSVPVIENATSYVWSVPTGVVITAGSNTNLITVSYSAAAVSGYISVYGSNSCGKGTVSPNFAVAVGDGISNNCANANSIDMNTVSPTVTVAGLSGMTLATQCTDSTVINEGWFKFTATTAYTVVTFSNLCNINVYVNIYTGSCDALTSIACLKTSSANINLVNFPTFMGQQYYIRILSVIDGAVLGRVGVYPNTGTNAMLCIPDKTSMSTGNASQNGGKFDNILNVGDQNGISGNDNFSVGFVKFNTSNIPKSNITVNGIAFALTNSFTKLKAGGKQCIAKLKSDAIDPVIASANQIYVQSTSATKFSTDIGPTYLANTTYVYPLNTTAISNFVSKYTQSWWGLCIPVQWNDLYNVGDYVNYYGWNSQFTPYVVVTYTSACITPTITQQPQANVSVCESYTATFSVTAEGTAPMIYQWYKDNISIYGATNSQVSILNPQITDSDSYTCVINNACGSKSTNTSILTVKQQPKALITAGGPTTIYEGDFVLLYSTTANGNTYQWQKNGENIQGETNSAYNATTLGDYNVIITNNQCFAISNSITVTVNQTNNVSIIPVGETTFCQGASVILVISKGTGSAYKYQWKKNNAVITDATTSLYTANQSGYYKVDVTDNNNLISTSNEITVTVNAIPLAKITAGGPTTFNEGGFVLLFASDANGNSYQWKKDGNTITDATNSSYSVSVAGSYTVVVTNNACSATSDPVIVVVTHVNNVTIMPVGSTSFCDGGSVILIISAGTGNGFTYQWKKDNISITGATKSIFTANQSGTYKVDVTDNNNNTSTSNEIVVAVYPLPAVDLGADVSITVNDSIVLTANADFTSYKWSNDLTAKSITVRGSALGVGTYTYSLTVTNSYSCEASDFIKVTVTAAKHSISGTVSYSNSKNTLLSKVIVKLLNLDNNHTDSCITATDGNYAFKDLLDGNYKITAKSNSVWGGSDPGDALMINRNYIGVTNITEKLKKYASDVTNDHTLDPGDALMVNRRYIGVLNTFKLPDWIFDTAVVVVNNADFIIDIKAICAGDVNGDFVPTSKKVINSKLRFKNSINVKEMEVFDLPINLTKDLEIGAIGIKLRMTNNEFQVKDVKSNIDGLIFNIINNELNIAWSSSSKAIELKENQTLVTLIVEMSSLKGTPSLNTENLLSLLESSIYDYSSAKYEGDLLSIPEILIQNSKFKIQNFPNPFLEQSNITYQIPVRSFVSLKVFDVLGKEVTTIVNETQDEGAYTVSFKPENLNRGIYFYKIKAGNDEAIGKMVYMK